MNTAPPLDLDTQDLVKALARSWGLEVGALRYVPKGFGSFHWRTETPTQQYFVTVDDLDTKPWLGGDRDSTFRGFQAAHDTALALQRDAHLDFVVAPVPHQGGGTALRLSERYTLAVFPFHEGESGVWGEPIDEVHRAQLLCHLAQVHGATPVVPAHVPRHDLVIHSRADLEAALDDLGSPWTGGPFSEPARQELANHAAAVRGWLVAFDRLADRVAPAGAEPVITHGEPHPGNLILTGSDVVLVDWDTVALAPPERDLWMLDDGSTDGLVPYLEASGRALDDRAIELYRLAWTLTEVAAFTAAFRSEHADDEGTQQGWRVLVDSLSGASSARPYGSPVDRL